MGVTIPEGYGSIAHVYTGSNGTSPYVVTHGIVLPDGAPLQDVVDLCFTAWEDQFLPNTFNEFTFDHTTLTVEAPGGGLGSVQSSLPPSVGAASGSAGLVAVAVLVNKVTGLLGRAGRGRMFIPGLLGETDIDVDGIIAGTSVDLYQDLCDNYQLALEAGDPGWTGSPNPQLLHSNALLAPNAISRFLVSPKVGILRRRLR